MAITLERNAYSPRVLAEELHFIVKPDFIRKQVAAGKIKAQRFGGKNIVILRADAEAWLANLPSATAPTNLGGSEDKPAKPDKKRKTASEISHEYQHRQRMAAFRRESRR